MRYGPPALSSPIFARSLLPLTMATVACASAPSTACSPMWLSPRACGSCACAARMQVGVGDSFGRGKKGKERRIIGRLLSPFSLLSLSFSLLSLSLSSPFSLSSLSSLFSLLSFLSSLLSLSLFSSLPLPPFLLAPFLLISLFLLT